jgi:flagellin
MRELAVQSANATLSQADRTALDTEFNQLVAEIERVADFTTYNGINLLDGSRAAATFQVGSAANQTVTMAAIDSAQTADLGTFTGVTSTTVAGGTGATSNGNLTITATGINQTLTNVENSARGIVDALNASGLGFTATANATTRAAGTGAQTASVTATTADLVINGVTITLTDTAVLATDLANTTAAINAQSAVTGVVATNTGAGVSLEAAAGDNIIVTFTSGAGTTALVAADFGLAAAAQTHGTFDYTFENAAASGTLTLGTQASDTQAIGTTGNAISAVGVDTAANATTAITAIDRALANIDATRATLGASQSRFESIVSTTMVARESAEASRSRVLDADFAVETANMTKGQILQQAGISVLAQANAMPQQVLSLLQ